MLARFPANPRSTTDLAGEVELPRVFPNVLVTVGRAMSEHGSKVDLSLPGSPHVEHSQIQHTDMALLLSPHTDAGLFTEKLHSSPRHPELDPGLLHIEQNSITSVELCPAGPGCNHAIAVVAEDVHANNRRRAEAAAEGVYANNRRRTEDVVESKRCKNKQVPEAFVLDTRFELWPVWTKVFVDKLLDQNVLLSRSTGFSRRDFFNDCREAQLKPSSLLSFMSVCGVKLLMMRLNKGLLINPSSHFFLGWNFAFVAIMCYELVMLPMRVFDLPENGAVFVISLLIAIFWTMDCVLSFFVGYFKRDGTIVMDRWRICRKYAKTWLAPDVVIVLVDWMLLAGTIGNSAGKFTKLLRTGKTFKYIRMLRLLRLIRLRKAIGAVHLVDEFVNCEYFTVIKSMCLNMLCILVISHFLSCLWFLLGSQRFGWVEHYQFGSESWSYQYFTSLHWSLTQLTPGSMSLQPQNIQERCFTVLVLVLGVIVFSSIVSSITAATNSLKSITARYDKQRCILRRFLREQDISQELVQHVTRYCDNIVKPSLGCLAREDVHLLSTLPRSLYMELVLEMYDQYFYLHPFFTLMLRHQRVVMQKICANALQRAMLSKGDLLFVPGETAHAMYFLAKGELTYFWAQSEEPEYVLANRWFCEAVLWTPWVHRGSMCCAEHAELQAVRRTEFQEVFKEHRAEIVVPRMYGAQFVRQMNSIAGFDTEDTGDDIQLSDLFEIPLPANIQGVCEQEFNRTK